MIIIPARLNSSRFPNKILADMDGKPLFVRSALNASKVDEVVVALDSDRAMEVARRYNIRAVMTSPDIENGSLRVLQASRVLGLGGGTVIINLQADEPLLEPSVIESLRSCIMESSFMATCAKKLDNLSDLGDPNLVKVILDSESDAIYFSRGAIPFSRDTAILPSDYLVHLGVYAFYKDTLEEFARLPRTSLEDIEKLEQLRAIYHKKQVKVTVVSSRSIGVDTEHDLQMAVEMHRRVMSEELADPN